MIFNEAIKHCDVTILEGHRGEKEQNEAFDKGFSKLRFPFSKHNDYPSMAVDAAPFPIDWKDTQRFAYFAGFIIGLGRLMLKGTGYKLISGADWNDNFYTKDHSFLDFPHFELVEDKTNTYDAAHKISIPGPASASRGSDSGLFPTANSAFNYKREPNDEFIRVSYIY